MLARWRPVAGPARRADETFDCIDTNPGVGSKGMPRRTRAPAGAHVDPFLLSFGVIFLAELGDKSQLMAMAFATRYRAAHRPRRRHAGDPARARRVRRRRGAVRRRAARAT